MKWPTSIRSRSLWRMLHWQFTRLHGQFTDMSWKNVTVIPMHLSKRQREFYGIPMLKKYFDKKEGIVNDGNDALLAPCVSDLMKAIRSIAKKVEDKKENIGDVEELIRRSKRFYNSNIKDKDWKKEPSNMIDNLVEYMMDMPFSCELYENGIVHRILGEIHTNNLRGQHKKGQAPDFFYLAMSSETDFDEKGYRKVTLFYSPDIQQGRELEGLYCKIPESMVDIAEVCTRLGRPLYKLLGNFDIEDGSNILQSSIVLPIYDFYIESRGYGGIQGIYIFFINGEQKGLEEDIRSLRNMEHVVENISNDIHSANILGIQKHQIPQRDFISYFLKTIVCVQDWENIWVTTKESSNEDLKEEHITHHWRRKEPQLKEGIFKYKWEDFGDSGADNDNRETSVNLLNKVKESKENYFKFCLEDMAFLFNKEDIHQYEAMHQCKDKYLICEYPKASIIPDPYKQPSDAYEFKDRLTNRFIQVFQIIIPLWWKDKTTVAIGALETSVAALRELQDSVCQASHNLGHAFDALDEELGDAIVSYLKKDKEFLDKIKEINSEQALKQFKEEVEPISKRIQSSLVTVKNTGDKKFHPSTLVHEGNIQTLLENRNFFDYIKKRLGYLSTDLQQTLNIENLRTSSLKDIFDYFNCQPILHRHITARTECSFPMTLSMANEQSKAKAFIFHSAGFQPFYVILENYVRNVSKHSKPLLEVNEKIDCHIRLEYENDQFYMSLYESTVKKLSEEYLKYIKGSFDRWKSDLDLNKGGSRGMEEIRAAARNLFFPEKEKFSTSLVLVSAKGEVQEEWIQSKDMFDDLIKKLEHDQVRLSFKYKFGIHTWPQRAIIFINNGDRILYLRNKVWVVGTNCIEEIKVKGLFHYKIYYGCSSGEDKGKNIDPFTRIREQILSPRYRKELDSCLEEAGLGDQEKSDISSLLENT